PARGWSLFTREFRRLTPKCETVSQFRSSRQATSLASPYPPLRRAPATDSPRPATADTGCNLSTPSVPPHSCQATGSHHRSADLPLRRVMVWRLNVLRTKAKLPVLRYAKAGAAVERAHAT